MNGDVRSSLLPRVHPALWPGLVLLLLFVFMLDMVAGSSNIPFLSVVAILLGQHDEPER